MNASSIETGSTSGVRSRMRARTARPTSAYFSMRGRTTRRVRAQPPRLEHRHRGAHPERARHIAAGEHHATLAAADDHRLVGERGVVPLLDRGIEGIAIDVRDRQRIELGVPQQPRRAAPRAARGSVHHVAAAVATETGCRGALGLVPPRAMLSTWSARAERNARQHGHYHETDCRIRLLAHLPGLGHSHRARRDAATDRCARLRPRCGRVRAGEDRPPDRARAGAGQVSRLRAVSRRTRAGGSGLLHQHRDDPQSRFQRSLSGRASERLPGRADRARRRHADRRQALPRRHDGSLRDFRAPVRFRQAQPARLGPGFRDRGSRRPRASATCCGCRCGATATRSGSRRRSSLPLRVTRSGELTPWKNVATAYAVRNGVFAALPGARGHGRAGQCFRRPQRAVGKRHRSVRDRSLSQQGRRAADAEGAAQVLAGRDQRPAGGLRGARAAPKVDPRRHQGRSRSSPPSSPGSRSAASRRSGTRARARLPITACPTCSRARWSTGRLTVELVPRRERCSIRRCGR